MAIIKKFRIKYFKKNKPIIEINNLSLSFGVKKILDNISFKINEGPIMGLLGKLLILPTEDPGRSLFQIPTLL